MTGSKRFKILLNALDIRTGDVIFLHTSLKYMSYLGLTANQILEILIEILGDDGTLVLPNYAWNLDKKHRPWKGYLDYFHKRPIFDIRKTPANIGWVPEVFRLMTDVRRSLSYWWSICAKGKLTKEITLGQEKVKHPYGEGSSFDLLRIHGVKILGLGVSLNTNSLALIPDHMLGGSHTQRIFTDEPQIGEVVDEMGRHIDTSSYWLMPDVVRLIKPSALIEASQKLSGVLRRVDEGSTIQFSYPYEIYHFEALRLGEKSCSRGSPVPWLTDYPLKQ